MTLTKAIGIAEDQVKPKPNYRNPELIDALKLGIEAMKVIEGGRGYPEYIIPRLLPGETEE